jgi:coenzyme F420-reducing hydrogenase gamma subunit
MAKKQEILKKLKIAVFDMTDCEGCEVVMVGLREKLVHLAGQTIIANWRLASHNTNSGSFDITFIEGSPISETDIEAVKQIRAASKIVIALGSCAVMGGVQAALGPKEWQKSLAEVYGKDYKTKSKSPKPLSYYIDVDYAIPGCPVDASELADFIAAVLANRKPTEIRYPVCLECKARENECLLLEGQPCLGPVTKGGCEAACPSRGLRCWGCFGALRGGNQKALKNNFEKKFGKERTEQLLGAFFTEQTEYKELYPKEK